MHHLRNALTTGEIKPANDGAPTPENCRRKGTRSLFDVAIPRGERRKADQRSEDRFQGVSERATIVFRRKTMLVPVVNVSSSGIAIEASITPCIGEILIVTLDGRAPVDGVVRWLKEGRLGLELPTGVLKLG